MIIQRIWTNQPGKYFCISSKDARKKWHDEFFTKPDFRKIPQYLERHSDRDLYFCPHGFTQPRRKKEFTVPPQLLWSDLDEVDPRTITPRPSIAFESSPGRYVGLWVTDQVVTEDMNKALSYKIGADKSGWDYTQVLRVPGTINYKYNDEPRTRILWSDGDRVNVADLPRVNGKAGEAVHASDASETYRKYERKLPLWLRRALLSDKAVQGKRSEMVWKIEQGLVELGLPVEDILTLVRASPWNKFAGRGDGEAQLRRELDKSINKRMNGHRVELVNEERELAIRSIDTVKEEVMEYAWSPYIPIGELTIIEGDPNAGKSYLTQMVARHICDGIALPAPPHTPRRIVQGKVLYFDTENSVSKTTKKRMRWNGLEHGENFFVSDVNFVLAESLDEVEEAMTRIRPKMVVFDTINSYLYGDTDSSKGNVVVSLAPFADLARDYNCAVVIIRWLTKGGRDKAIYRGQGNIAFTGKARSVIQVGMTGNGLERAFGIGKANDSLMPPVHTFMIKSEPTLREPNKSVFEWGVFAEELSTGDFIQRKDVVKSDSGKIDGAVEYLREKLSKGSVPGSDVFKDAEARSFSRMTIKRACKILGVKRTTGASSAWSLGESD